jgi:RNA polymerase sigma-70 factor (ECF subfamily)
LRQSNTHSQHRVLLSDENRLVRAAADGDQASYAQLYTYYYPNLKAAINFITHDADETDEILQETFLRIWNIREKLVLVQSFENYALKIARNFLIDLLRRKKVHQKAIATLSYRPLAADIKDQLEYKELHELALKAIQDLDEQKRDIFLLRTEQGLGFNEIADRYGIAIVTVKKHYYAAYHALKAVLEQHSGPLALLFFLWGTKK